MLILMVNRRKDKNVDTFFYKIHFITRFISIKYSLGVFLDTLAYFSIKNVK